MVACSDGRSKTALFRRTSLGDDHILDLFVSRRGNDLLVAQVCLDAIGAVLDDAVGIGRSDPGEGIEGVGRGAVYIDKFPWGCFGRGRFLRVRRFLTGRIALRAWRRGKESQCREEDKSETEDFHNYSPCEPEPRKPSQARNPDNSII